MTLTASSISTNNTLEQLRNQFNNLITDVEGLETGTKTFSALTATTTSSTFLNVLEDGNIVFEGATDDAFETTLTVADPTADRTITLPNLTGTVSLISGTETLTNKTLTTPTLTSPVLNTAISGSAFLDEDNMASDSATKLASQQSIKAYVDSQLTAEDLDITTDSGTIAIDLDSETLTIAGGTGIDTTGSSNTITVAVDSTVATLTGTQTMTNKTLTSPTINSPTITTLTATNLTLTDSSIVFEGATADAHETTLTVTDPTADRTITLPNETGTLITSASAATNAFSISIAAALG